MTDELTLLVVIGDAAATPAPLSSKTALPSSVRGESFSGAVIGVGGEAPYTYAEQVGTLPAGMSLDPATGVITGTPTTQGYTEVTIRTTDNNGDTFDEVISVPVGGGIVIDRIIPEAEHGIDYLAILSATGGTPPYTWTDPNTTLPAWASIVGDTITGTADNFSNFQQAGDIRLRATDANGNYAEADMTLSTWPPVMVSSLFSVMPNEAFVAGNYLGQAEYRHGVSNVGPGAGGAAGGPAGVFSLANAPTGLVIDAATGAVSGVVATGGDYMADVTVTDALGGTSTLSFPIRVFANGQMKKYTTSIGDGVETDFSIQHKFNSLPYSVLVSDKTTYPMQWVSVPFIAEDLETIVVSFKEPPAVDQFDVKVLG